jgi:hypothetical protein
MHVLVVCLTSTYVHLYYCTHITRDTRLQELDVSTDMYTRSLQYHSVKP